MVIPWTLLGTAVAALVVGILWSRRLARSAGLPSGAPVDVALTVGLGALVGARLVAVAIDVALSGVLPGIRGLLTLGAGLSTPGAVLGGLAAGWWVVRRHRPAPAVWAAAVPAAAAALAVWSVLALVRGDAAGIVAPVPLGWPLPGVERPRVPVAVLEAVAYAGAALVLGRRVPQADAGSASPRRRGAPPPDGARLAASVGVVVAAVHLAGSVLRPAAPTADADLDVLLGLGALGLVALVARGVRRTRVLVAAASLGSVAAVLVAIAGLGGGAAAPIAPDPGVRPAGLEQAIIAGGDAASPPAWDEAHLAGFVAAADGRPVVVNFWASWCPPCHAEAPALSRVAAAYADDVAFLGVVVSDEPARAAAFAERYALPFPSVLDGGLRGALGAAGLPTTVVLRADGTVAARTIGGIDARGLAAAIDRAGP